jgi:hypothetical protein
MSLLSRASVEDRKRLLELFPVANLREVFESKKTKKEEICYAEAVKTGAAQVKRIAEFVDNHLGCCKQHVYVFSHDGSTKLPADVADGEKVLDVDGESALYLSRAKYVVVLRDPLEEDTLEFLWPIGVELKRVRHSTAKDYMIVRFVVLEKNVSSYFDRPAYVAGKSITEETVLAGVAGGLPTADLNKGIKKLWADGYIESIRSRFKKKYSLSSETMDEERGIKEHYPDLYAIMQQSPLYTTLFEVNDDANTIDHFSADPSRGIIGFSSYSDKGDTDAIIGKIISNN